MGIYTGTQSFYKSSLRLIRVLLENLEWFVQAISVQTFPPIVIIFRRDDFAYLNLRR